MISSKEKAKKRIEICEGCEHFKPSSRTCGTPIVGNWIGDVKLCGCFMDAKTKISFSSCPFSLWDDLQVTKNDYLAMKKLLHEVNHQIDGGQKKTLFEMTKKYFGSKTTSSNCKPCLNKALEQIKRIVSEYEQD